ENQKIINSVYDDFKNYTNFITISYKGSGDDLNDVIGYQGSYPWFFALDTANYASVAGTQNADVWILDQQLNLIYTWDYAIITKSDFVDKLSQTIGIVTSEITSETVITSTETITSSTIITENNSTITSEMLITSETTFTSETVITTENTISVADMGNDINTLGLFENSLFLGFISFSIIGVIYIQIAKRR
ncbi:MAG: hypothetical protein GPJ54_01195, partial [Candidatus Heimdallarchaeota archaeon]|nr:hypothetical protein [Candidatus Heimdallarchaeota archaeon]